MESPWIEYIPWVYLFIQGIVTIIVSVIGANYVRNEFRLQASKMHTELIVHINIEKEAKATDDSQQEEQKGPEIDPQSQPPPSTENSKELEVSAIQLEL